MRRLRRPSQDAVIGTTIVTLTLTGLFSILYFIGNNFSISTQGGPMVALALFGSVCVICATAVYLLQADSTGKNRVKMAEAEKKVERIMRADRVVEHK